MPEEGGRGQQRYKLYVDSMRHQYAAAALPEADEAMLQAAHSPASGLHASSGQLASQACPTACQL